MKTRLYILDPHPVTAEGLRRITVKDSDIQIIGEAVESKTALTQIPS